MSFNAKKGGLALVLAGLFAAPQLPAAASLTATLNDTYTGGIDPYAYTSQNAGTDSVGGTPFTVSSANVSLSGSQLSVTINTAYAGKAGTDGTTYGDLFLNSTYSPISTTSASTLATAWNSVLPSNYQVTANSSLVQAEVQKDNAAGGYLGDVYQKGDWNYVVVMLDANGKPVSTTDTTMANTGKIALYKVLNTSTTLDSKGGGMVLSNAGGCATTAGLDNNCSDYYRAGEAVQYIPDSGQVQLAVGSYTINPTNGTINYSFNDSAANLGDNFAISWAMTCANDVIQGMVSLPEPGAWALLLLGMAGLGGMRYRTRRTAQSAAL